MLLLLVMLLLWFSFLLLLLLLPIFLLPPSPGGPDLLALGTAGVLGAGVGFAAAPAINGFISSLGKK